MTTRTDFTATSRRKDLLTPPCEETDPRGDDWEDDVEEPPPGSEDGNPDPPKDDE